MLFKNQGGRSSIGQGRKSSQSVENHMAAPEDAWEREGAPLGKPQATEDPH